MPEVNVHAHARIECRAAVAWYQDRSHSVAGRFAAEVTARPVRYALYDGTFREAGLFRFPYIIVYPVEATGDVLTVAVAHPRCEPG